MKMKTIKKSISIGAPKEKVWNVLVDNKINTTWLDEFCEGSQAQTDWQEGSKVAFTTPTEEGMLGKISANKPAELLSIEYTGVLTKGKEDYESEYAQFVKGSHETYWLSESDGVTQLDIESDMDEKYFDTMSEAWDRALVKIDKLAKDK